MAAGGGMEGEGGEGRQKRIAWSFQFVILSFVLGWTTPKTKEIYVAESGSMCKIVLNSVKGHFILENFLFFGLRFALYFEKDPL
jgi:hypothetical protein